MKLVIIESPYAGDVARNIDYAKRAMAHCLTLGEAPLASHLLYTQPGILNDDIPNERTLGINAGLAWYAVADKIIFYTDLGFSPGMHVAFRHATHLGKNIELRTLPAK